MRRRVARRGFGWRPAMCFDASERPPKRQAQQRHIGRSVQIFVRRANAFNAPAAQGNGAHAQKIRRFKWCKKASLIHDVRVIVDMTQMFPRQCVLQR